MRELKEGMPEAIIMSESVSDIKVALEGIDLIQIEPRMPELDKIFPTTVNEDLCSGCRICESSCPSNLLVFDDRKKVMRVNETSCKGCGQCIATCPSGALQQTSFSDAQIFAMIEGITHPARGEVRPFCCNLCPRSVTDLTNSIQYPSTSTVVRLMCSGKAEPSIILRSFDLGFDGVLILGCYLGDHRGISKDGDIGKRVEITKELMQTLGLEQDRLLLEGISASDPELTVIAKGFIDKLKNLGPSPLRRGVVC